MIKIVRCRSKACKCTVCQSISDEPRKRLYLISVGRIVNSYGGTQQTDVILCDDCMEELGEMIWGMNKPSERDTLVYKPTNMKELPACCGDCKDLTCRIQYDSNGYIPETYMNKIRHENCPLTEIRRR